MNRKLDLNTLDAKDRASTIASEINSALPDDYQAQLREESIRETTRRKSGSLPRKILLVGGAGYIGTIVSRHLLDRGYAVKCLDNLIYGHHFTVLPFLTRSNYEFVNTDIRHTATCLEQARDCTDVVILAGLVGDPITKKYPEESEAINSVAIGNLIEGLNNLPLVNKAIFVSTCSNYGLIRSDELASEDFELTPLSLYAKSKVAIEKQLLENSSSSSYCPTALRFATAFGFSPRMRFDLTVSEFIRDLYLGKELVVYDADTWRPYCHVEDFAELIRRVIEAPVERVRNQVFNAGSEQNNLTKRMIVDKVCNAIQNSKITYQEHGSDPRNYRVDFTKVQDTLYFDASYDLDYGIRELLNVLQLGFFADSQVKGNSLYGNYELVND